MHPDFRCIDHLINRIPRIKQVRNIAEALLYQRLRDILLLDEQASPFLFWYQAAQGTQFIKGNQGDIDIQTGDQ